MKKALLVLSIIMAVPVYFLVIEMNVLSINVAYLMALRLTLYATLIMGMMYKFVPKKVWVLPVFIAFSMIVFFIVAATNNFDAISSILWLLILSTVLVITVLQCITFYCLHVYKHSKI